MERKLSKVVFWYDDGTSKFIEGDQLDKWGGMNRQVALFCQMHKNNPDWSSVKWTEVEAVGPKEEEPAKAEEPVNVVTALD